MVRHWDNKARAAADVGVAVEPPSQAARRCDGSVGATTGVAGAATGVWATGGDSAWSSRRWERAGVPCQEFQNDTVRGGGVKETGGKSTHSLRLINVT